ncbi:uncharacterized protein LOC106672315 isoform X2 [Cimex lectularius]|uniref:Uncharacterized protein n=1 Tax=Cimex lectularius TaxID=79782 RepID=A0A8I6S789_CIMLE|nr:uncharacterized protein LOC106672315 isoform X2 [Cimex lectularius]
MASCNDVEAGSEANVPQWKKELIERRRASGRAITSTSGAGGIQSGVGFYCSERVGQEPSSDRATDFASQPSQDFHPDFCVRTMRLLDSKLPGELIVSGSSIKCNNSVSDIKSKMVEEKPVKKTSFRNKDERNYKVFGLIRRNGKEEEYQSDSSEELQYGPGIVNKLKSKYLSMTLRDNQKYSARPSLSSMRRATSLENMLEDESTKSIHKPHFVKKPYHSSAYKSTKISQHHAKYLGLTRGSESMKRARSMDTLIKNDAMANPSESKQNRFINGLRPSIINEDLIIVDNCSHTEESKHVNTGDRELPPPDVVKQTLKIFEPVPVKNADNVKKINKTSTSPNNSPVKNKPAKPALSPKPNLIPDKRSARPKMLSPRRIFPVVTKEGQKSPPAVVPVANEKPLSPKKRPTVEKSPLAAPLKFAPLQDKPPVVPVKTPAVLEKFDRTSPAKERPFFITNKSDSSEDTPKYVSQKAMENISKEGTSVTFSFCESLSPNKSHLPRRNLTQATNTALITSQTATNYTEPPSSPPKQVAVIRPVITNKPSLNLTEQEIEKNLINKVKSVETSVISTKNDDTETKTITSEKSQLWDKKSWQNQNTMVFNFSGRQSVPDYIENDGLNLTQNRITAKLNGGKDEADGSGDEDTEESIVCNVRFVGDNILINGKSNLKKESKENKKKIQFNDDATVMFEYPSEESLKEEVTSPNALNSPLPLGGPNLSSYTPSKTVGQDSFELGVTRVIPPPAPSSQPPTTQEIDYLKPIDSNHETTWSQETATDILF